MSMTEFQKFRIEIAAQILSAKLEDTILSANRETVTPPTKLRIEGALRIADELIKVGTK